MNRWQKQTMYILRDSVSGVITGISETVPSGYIETTEEGLRKAYSASTGRVSEYQKRHIAKKRLWMGGD